MRRIPRSDPRRVRFRLWSFRPINCSLSAAGLKERFRYRDLADIIHPLCPQPRYEFCFLDLVAARGQDSGREAVLVDPIDDRFALPMDEFCRLRR